MRMGAWLFATLAIWAALLRLPLYGACSLLLAAGLGRLIGECGRGPCPAPAAAAIRPGGAPRRAGHPGGPLVGSGGRSGIPRGGRIAGTARGRPQRRADRLGHRPRLQPEPVRLSPGHHPQPVAVGAAGRPVQPGRGAGPVDVSLAWLHLHRPVAVPAQFPVEVHARHAGSRPWPSTWPRGAIRPPGSRRTPTCCNYETGLARGFAHFEDYPLTPRSLLGRTVPGTGSS